jgi:hypothetical protein
MNKQNTSIPTSSAKNASLKCASRTNTPGTKVSPALNSTHNANTEIRISTTHKNGLGNTRNHVLDVESMLRKMQGVSI